MSFGLRNDSRLKQAGVQYKQQGQGSEQASQHPSVGLVAQKEAGSMPKIVQVRLPAQAKARPVSLLCTREEDRKQ